MFRRPAGARHHVAGRSVSLAVSNGSGATNQATDVSARLDRARVHGLRRRRHHQGADPTIVRYAPGLRAQADQVARQLAAGAELQEDTSLARPPCRWCW